MASLVKSHRAAKGSEREMYPSQKSKKAKKNASKSSKNSGGAGAKYAETPSSSPLPSSRSSSNTKVAGRPERSAKKTQKKGPARENPPSSAKPKATAKGPKRENPPAAKAHPGLMDHLRKSMDPGQKSRLDSYSKLGSKIKDWFSGEMADRKKNRRTIK